MTLPVNYRLWFTCSDEAQQPPPKASFPHSQVVLLVGAEGVVDVSLQVDGQVRDPQDGPGNVNQPVDEPGVSLPAHKDKKKVE